MYLFFSLSWVISPPSDFFTYEYSISETGAKRKAGQVKDDRSPENDASDFKKEWKAPFCSVGIWSTLLTSPFSAIINQLNYVYIFVVKQERRKTKSL